MLPMPTLTPPTLRVLLFRPALPVACRLIESLEFLRLVIADGFDFFRSCSSSARCTWQQLTRSIEKLATPFGRVSWCDYSRGPHFHTAVC
mmetsp:Transcript_129087/g.251366  ORF Transcript_129087/g.251366 Transcript_129087/m.251366 type:complete len:90 (+) Transcript_129087:1665-1934(+)